MLDGFLSLRTARTDALGEFVTGFFNLRPFAVLAAIVVVAAAYRGRARMAAAVMAILLGANVTTQLLKTLTAAPREPVWLPDASWPSGHVTAAASLALCVVLVAPSVLRPWAVGAGALGVLTVAYSILIVGSHHASDVLGGMLVAGAWSGAVVAVLERRRPVHAGAHGRRLWLAPAAAVIAVGALLVVVAAVEPLAPYLSDHTTFFVGAVVLATCGAVIPAVAGRLAE